MIVTIEDDVFSALIPPLLLLSIIQYGAEGRHIILTDPSLHQAGSLHLNAWLAQRDSIVRASIQNALDRSQRSLPNSQSRVWVRLTTREQSHWGAAQPLLTPEDTAVLLSLPLRLVLEDRYSDRHFLTCVLPEPKRKELREALMKGWCRTEHGGGLGSMSKYVDGLKQDPAEKLRTWVMFDRDTQSSGEPSRESLDLKAKCEDASLSYAHHQLQRRSIENYLPPEALWHWASLKRGTSATGRQRKAREFEALKPAGQRHHIDMKETFGDDIATLFREEDFRIDPRWLEKDGQRPELDLIAKSLFARM